MPLRLSALLLLGLSVLACHAATPDRANPQPQDLQISPATRARAATILQIAGKREPALTKELQEIASHERVRLHGLAHRLKSAKSLARKIQTNLVMGKTAKAEDVVIYDALRYTFLIEEEPAGHYDRAAKNILARLEASGHGVRQVKNYWPRGDSYSGLNCVLSFPDGFLWELQFHTMGSLAAKKEGHDLYEIMPLPGTTHLEKQRIFDRLTRRWDWVLIPEGILTPHSVHAMEVLRVYKRP